VQVPEIAPRELKSRLDHGDDIFILDVREPHEYQICNLKGHLIPLGELTRACTSWILRGKLWRIAGAESAPRRQWISFAKRGSARFLNLKGGISRGPTKWTRPFEVLIRFSVVSCPALQPGRGVYRLRLLPRESIGILLWDSGEKWRRRNYESSTRLHPRGG